MCNCCKRHQTCSTQLCMRENNIQHILFVLCRHPQWCGRLHGLRRVKVWGQQSAPLLHPAPRALRPGNVGSALRATASPNTSHWHKRRAKKPKTAVSAKRSSHSTQRLQLKGLADARLTMMTQQLAQTGRTPGHPHS